MKSKKFVINCEVYNFSLIISIGETDREFFNTLSRRIPVETLEELKKDSSIILDDSTLAKTHIFESGYIFIRLRKKPSTAYEYGTLAHEIFHVVELWFDKIDLPLTPESAEAYAYLIGYLTTQIYKKL